MKEKDITCKPISPAQALEEAAANIPSAVFEVVNGLIVEHLCDGEATIRQDEIVDALVNDYGFERREIFDKHYLDFERAYRQEGWFVRYDKPGFNESYGAFFEFKMKK